jgi:hypothetical protein
MEDPMFNRNGAAKLPAQMRRMIALPNQERSWIIVLCKRFSIALTTRFHEQNTRTAVLDLRFAAENNCFHQDIANVPIFFISDLFISLFKINSMVSTLRVI